MIFTPRAYQPPTTDWILQHDRCALWLPMGLGKSISTLNALDILAMSGETHPVLIGAPLRVARTTWPDEVKKWDHLSGMTVVPITGSLKERRQALDTDAQIYTVNYEILPWLIEYLGERWPFRTFIADESTKLKSLRLSERISSTGKTYLAGQGGMRAKALGKLAHTKIKRFVELTGTPSPNGLNDLWGQMWFLDKGARLGRTFTAFQQRWFQKSYDGYGSDPMPHAQAEIQDLLRDICLTIDPADHFDLKAPIVNNIYVDLPSSARKLYKSMENDFFMSLEGHAIEAFNAAARSLKCLQIANGAAYLDAEVDGDGHPKAKLWKDIHDEKLQALEEIIEEAGGAPVIVSYHFQSDLARLQKKFKNGRALVTQQDEKDFKRGKIPILFTHPQSAGHGIDGFQNVCNTIVFFSQNWSLDCYQQIIERIGPVRQMQAGFDRPVFVHHILARHTIDELVLERVMTKRSVQDILMQAMKERK